VLLAAFLILLCVLLAGSSASASPPVYEGGWFPEIHGPSDPEEFSWEVSLAEDQELRTIDEHEVAVYYSTGERAFDINATPARAVDGATVPTSIRISGENMVILTVHHREGNPSAGGAPFDYPIVGGVGWEGGFRTITVPMGPPDEQELRERRERQERAAMEEREAAAQAERCHVPALHGATLAGARNRLRRGNCRLGAIAKPRGVMAKTGRVVGQTRAPGSSFAHDAKVGVTLGQGGGRSRT
jgi:hypothetical protein